MVYDHHVIRTRYLHGWFVLDFISMLPVDLLSYTDWLSPRHQKGMRIMRLIKLLRLVPARSPPRSPPLSLCHPTVSPTVSPLTVSLTVSPPTQAASWMGSYCEPSGPWALLCR
jgi:hypothetical protein